MMKSPVVHNPSQKPDIKLCANANLRQATRIISQLYDATLKPAGIKATQFTMLAVLAKRGEMPLTKLAELLVVDRTTLTRNLQPLIKKGWLKIGREVDERVRLISITKEGEGLVSDATPYWQHAQEIVQSSIGTEKVPELISDLNALVKKVQER
ncbi:MAG: MarR family winged helix-turn-helix transcriptional regulator [Rhizobiaceae bacterium]